MARVTIENLTKRFGPVTAIKEMNLEIADREFLVLLGPSGAGKTTTLRCAAGLEKPDGGEVYFDEQPMSGIGPAMRDVTFVFQSYALFPRKSAYENIASPLLARHMPKAEIDTKVREVADKLHIGHLLARRPSQMSGGEQQRVALCRAMVRRPRVFLMDEPLTNLDFKLRVEMRTELKHLHADLNTTFFYVTNDQLEALSLADRIAVLNKGVLQQVDTPENVYDHPVNRFVAGFIGSPTMNFIESSLSGEGNSDAALVSDGWSLPIPPAKRDAIRQSGAGSVVLGVRPEDIEIRMQPRDSEIPAEVFAVEPLGDRTIYDVKLGSSDVRVKAPPTLMINPGEIVYLHLNADRIKLFDPKTDQAIL